MTSLLPDSSTARRTPGATGRRPAPGGAHRRPLVLTATLGGVAAAGATLLVCLAVAVIGWFLTDAGAHGEPHDALRVGALAWLTAHGSGVVVGGVALTAVPLGLTALCAWSCWRVGLRVGDAVSGHGPDADAISDGERDWTVPVAALLFTVAYAVVAVGVVTLAATATTAPATTPVLGWVLGLGLLVATPAIAVASGRAAIWAPAVPPVLRHAARVARRLLVTWLALSAAAFLLALLVDLDTAANVLSQLHTDAGDATAFSVASLAVVPNAVLFAASYLVGPGFTVGVGTLVSPSAVVLGPLPMFPLLAALPDTGPTPAWTVALVALPALVAAVVAVQAQRRAPTLRWDEGALRGCAGGVVAGLVLGLLASLAGGAVGPGRMRDVGPLAHELTVHAVTAFGLGGLVGGLLVTAWQRHRSRDLDGEAPAPVVGRPWASRLRRSSRPRR
ncbi:DUF6350 family protein [Nocardioides sp. Leaf374]|uniref:cell division protein PerM n=1 Tax=Nocardioides sp. Leaf374 TaxID=2876560 RepID=UPI001E60FE4D|nr:DUF6350 family protein [Nocardioides sp. Leaf374]